MIIFKCDAEDCEEQTTGYADYDYDAVFDDEGWVNANSGHWCPRHFTGDLTWSSGHYHPDWTDAGPDQRAILMAKRAEEMREATRAHAAVIAEELRRREEWDAGYEERKAAWEAYMRAQGPWPGAQHDPVEHADTETCHSRLG